MSDKKKGSPKATKSLPKKLNASTAKDVKGGMRKNVPLDLK